ncbi:MAG TPA: hypothetical protein VFY97_06325 [Rhodanobacteraceae bacterium]|nr:hypothetical protein [Rhodanobacteraceae bacterium]
MKRLYRSTALAAAAGLFFSASLHAQLMQYAATCNGCTASQVEALLPDCALGYQYVGDFDADRLYLGCYQVKGTQPLVKPLVKPLLGLPGERHYVWRQPGASEQNTFEAYRNVYALNGHVMAANAQVSVNADLGPALSLGDDGYMNAYDVVSATQNKDAVKNWLFTTVYTTTNTMYSPFVSPALASALVALLNDIKTGIMSFDFNINVTLVFHDGSQAAFHYDPHNLTWSYVPGSARDGHGNLIPDSYAAIGGSGGQVYDFTNPHPGYDVYNFDALLQAYGIQPTGSTTTVLECVTVGGTPSCHYVTLPD